MDRDPGKIKPREIRVEVAESVSGDFLAGSTLVADAGKCLRFLPGRRSVWKAKCGGWVVVLKLFDKHPKQGRDAGREWENTLRMHGAGLPVAEPLFRGATDGGELAVAFGFIPDGRVLSEVMAGGDDALVEEGLRQLVEVHARQHACGCYQSDDHFGNYMWSGGRVYILDAGSCVFRSGELGMDDRVANMAMLTANVTPGLRGVYDGFLAGYPGLCPEGFDGAKFVQAMERKLPEVVKTRLWKYLRKTRRSSSKLERCEVPSGVLHVCRDLGEDVRRAFLTSPDEVKVAGYVVRRYGAVPWLRRVLGAKSPALEDWSVGHGLRMLGMPVARPVACLLRKNGEGFLMVESVVGTQLDELAVAEMPGDLPGQFAGFWETLRGFGVRVGDVGAGDFSVDEQGGLVMTDVSGIRFDPSGKTGEGEIRRGLTRLFDGWQGDPEVGRLLREGC